MEKEFTNDTILARWLSGELSAEELQELESRDDFEAFQKIANEAAQLQPPTFEQDKVWNKINQQIGSNPSIESKTTKNRRLGWWRYAAAAAVLLLIGTFYFLRPQAITVIANLGEHPQTTLPDGSKVWMNAVSNLEYQLGDWPENRIVNLEGEAFFEVQKGSSFVVKTPNGEVTVLGTSFNVYSRNGYLEVNCHTGKVEVTKENATDSNILNPGKGIRIGEDGIAIPVSFTPTKNPAWDKQESLFKNTLLPRVFDDLERQYEIGITFKVDIEKRVYSGKFPHGNIEEALKAICIPMNLTYELSADQKKVIIK